MALDLNEVWKYPLVYAAGGTREEKMQFFRDIHIDDWNPEPEFWTLEGILRGKPIDEQRLCRYLTLGWVRCNHLRPPGYELTCRGEVVRDRGRDLIEDEDDY